ncbi:50S ribosomal protein L25/general stress protein Ctc [bacterium]|nr:50S ribosomal protein L25/general stress protein Ctc [bacterium]
MVATSIKYELHAQTREGKGRGEAREVRRSSRIPAVVYGKGLEKNAYISLDEREFLGLYNRPGFYSHVFEILTGGKEKLRAVPRDVQLHPVTDKPEHVDFHYVAPGEKVRVKVALRFNGADKSPGIKKGGTLNIVRRDLELMCDPDHIPQVIDIDLSDVKMAQSIHISHIALPQGATPTITERDFTICTIVGRRGQKDEDESGAPGAAAAGAEGDKAAEGDKGGDKAAAKK